MREFVEPLTCSVAKGGNGPAAVHDGPAALAKQRATGAQGNDQLAVTAERKVCYTSVYQRSRFVGTQYETAACARGSAYDHILATGEYSKRTKPNYIHADQ